MVRRGTPVFASAFLVASLGLGTAACGDDDDINGPGETVFAAELSGANEVPPVPTSASGTAMFVLSDGTVSFEVEVVNLVEATAAHIHVGGPTENGDIVVTLFEADPPVSIAAGVLADGEFTAGDVVGITFGDLLALMETGGAYVNVHTTANPPGEMRGQITRQ